MRDRADLNALGKGKKMEWKYLIVDEGHRIKNLNCRLIKELKQYQTGKVFVNHLFNPPTHKP